MKSVVSPLRLYCFNLVIEYLLISTTSSTPSTKCRLACFNLVIEYLLISTPPFRASYLSVRIECFNLVIEYLLISTYRQDCLKSLGIQCFNLVIEYLLISTSRWGGFWYCRSSLFQSRNRVSSNFNRIPGGTVKGVLGVSIS